MIRFYYPLALISAILTSERTKEQRKRLMSNYVTFIEKEFILNQLIRGGGDALLFGSGKSVACAVKAFNKDSISLEGKPAELAHFSSWEGLSVYLAYQGQRLTFQGKVLKVDGLKLILAMPERFFKAPQRKAIRVAPPKDLVLEFFLQNDAIRIDCPESNEYMEIELPVVREGFDMSSLNTLLSSFKAKADARYAKNGVVMFAKGRKPEGPEETIIAKLGKVLLVASTKSPLPSVDPYEEARVITQKDADAYEGPSIFLEGSDLEKARHAKAAKGVISELYCPILYYQYVVGYVYVMNDESMKTCLDFRAVDFAWEFARILAYNLKAYGYFSSDESYHPQPHTPAVLDLSAGGCLFTLPKSDAKTKLRPSAIIDFGIRRGDEGIRCKGRVVRRFDDKERDYYGISFVALEASATEFLRRSLYAEGASVFSCDELAYATASGAKP
jgi:hypothetical protein